MGTLAGVRQDGIELAEEEHPDPYGEGAAEQGSFAVLRVRLRQRGPARSVTHTWRAKESWRRFKASRPGHRFQETATAAGSKARARLARAPEALLRGRRAHHRRHRQPRVRGAPWSGDANVLPGPGHDRRRVPSPRQPPGLGRGAGQGAGPVGEGPLEVIRSSAKVLWSSRWPPSASLRSSTWPTSCYSVVESEPACAQRSDSRTSNARAVVPHSSQTTFAV